MKPDNISNWLDEDHYKKLLGQTRLQVGGILQPLRKYGQGVYVDGAITEIMKLIEDSWLAVRGIDKPVSVDYIRRKR